MNSTVPSGRTAAVREFGARARRSLYPCNAVDALRALTLAALAALTPAPVVAQTVCSEAVVVSLRPPTPRRGTLFTVRVRGAGPGVQLGGQAGAEPLHFVPGSDGSAESHAAAPIDADSLGITVVCGAASRADTLVRSVALARGGYPTEKLRVAPEFTAPPDSALRRRIEREGALAAAVGRAAHSTPRLWSAPFRAPRPSRITSRYGGGREFNGTVTSRHMGTDYAGATGSPVRAGNRGVVRLVDRFFLGGNVVYVDHGAGLLTAYLHLSRALVAVGDTVERGAVIGRVGATGRVTGPHLHYIARYGNTSFDPLSLPTGAAPVGRDSQPRRTSNSALHASS